MNILMAYIARPLLALLLLLLAMTSVQAAVVCSAPMALNVPATTEGLYVNLVTGVSGVSEASVPGFDIDIYAAASTSPSGQLRYYWGPASNGGAGVVVSGDTFAVLGSGVTISASSLFSRAAFAGNTNAWQAGTSGYLGMRFQNEATSSIVYGWMALTTTAAFGFPATISGWCYENSGAGIVTPSPVDAIFASGFDS